MFTVAASQRSRSRGHGACVRLAVRGGRPIVNGNVMSAVNFERALNRSLPRHQVTRSQSPGQVFAVQLLDYPQCRGEGNTVSEAMRAVRRQFNHLRDCRVCWLIDDLLADLAVQAGDHPDLAAVHPAEARGAR